MDLFKSKRRNILKNNWWAVFKHLLVSGIGKIPALEIHCGRLVLKWLVNHSRHVLKENGDHT